jgi:hypothetical protein
MGRWLFRWIASLLIVAACALPAPAQDQSNKQGDDSGDITISTAALPAVVAVLSTLLVLVIVCKPSRKS